MCIPRIENTTELNYGKVNIFQTEYRKYTANI